MGQGHPLKVVLGHDGVSSISGNLVLKIQEARAAIIEDTRGRVPILLGLPSSSVKESTFDLGNDVVTEDSVAWDMGSLEQSSFRLWVLADSCSLIRSSSLLAILTGSTLGLFSDESPAQTQCQLVKKSTKTKLLNMGKAKMPKFDMPSHPNLLVGCQVLVGVADNGGHGLEGRLGCALSEQSDPGQETGIISHGHNVSSILVPLGPVVKDSEVVFQLANWLPRPVLREESLGADNDAGKISMKKDIHGEGYDIAFQIQSFKIDLANKVDGQSTSNSIQNDGLRQAPDGTRDTQIKPVTGTHGSSTVHDGSENVRGPLTN